VLTLSLVHVPVLAVFVPFLGAFISYAAGWRSERLRDWLVVLFSGIAFILVAMLFPVIAAGEKLYYAPDISFLFYPPVFSVDGLSYALALATSFVWLAGTVYALSYMTHEHKRNCFYLFWLLSLSVDLGVLFAGDLLTLYIFFELLTVFSYVLVIHTETAEAMAAGRKYLFMGVAGGLSLLAGILLLYHHTGTLELGSVLSAMSGLGYMGYLICGLMVLGFGVKAGMYPVHVWLPDAHPVAPSPASALLSGVMIKAGAYGIFRTVALLFMPAVVLLQTPAMTSNIGYVLIWLGIITMSFSVILALMQENSKRMLAYCSIDQMGYIILGIGCAAFLGADGGIGIVGGLSHIVNHALFKSCLFLAVGAVFFRVGELNMYKLGGLWRVMPFTAFAMFVAVMGISGVPGFNGYVSKVLLHHAIVESWHHGGYLLNVAEILFVVVAGGTFASNIKMFLFTFFGKRPEGLGGPEGGIRDAPFTMKAAMGVIAGAIILFGIMPGLLMDLVMPAVSGNIVSAESLLHLVEYQVHAAALFYTPENILVAATELMIGGIIFVTGIRFGWFHWEHRIPRWIGPDYWYARLARGFLWFCAIPATHVDRALDHGSSWVGRVAIWLFTPHPLVCEPDFGKTFTMKELTKTLDDIIGNPVPVLGKVVSRLFMGLICILDEVAAYLYAFVRYGMELVTRKPGEPITGIHQMKRQFMEKFRPSMPYLTSIEFGLFLVALMLAVYSLYILVRYLIFSVI